MPAASTRSRFSVAPRVRAHPAPPPWLLVTIACSVQFMVVLDVSVVNVALPAMRSDLALTTSQSQWVVNSYVLTFAGLLLLGGRIADVYGRRRVTIAGLVIFTGSSLVGGLAGSAAMLIAARVGQGIGAAVLAPASLTIIVTTFTNPVSRQRAIGLWSAFGGAGGAAGVLIGGALTSLVSWRWVLLINVPVGLVALGASVVWLRDAGVALTVRTLDVAGAVTATIALSAVSLMLINTEGHALVSTATMVPLLVAGASAILFVVIETRWSHAPLLPFTLVRGRATWSANLVMLLVAAPFFATWYLLSLCLQEVAGASALETGLAFLPSTLLVIIGAQISARLAARVGVRPLVFVGIALNCVGLVGLAQIDLNFSTILDVVMPSAVAAFGLGLVFTPLAICATDGVAPADSGLASGLLTTARQVGGSVGLALMGAVAARATATQLDAGTSSANALILGYQRGFLVGVILATLAFVAAFAIPRRVARVRGEIPATG